MQTYLFSFILFLKSYCYSSQNQEVAYHLVANHESSVMTLEEELPYYTSSKPKPLCCLKGQDTSLKGSSPHKNCSWLYYAYAYVYALYYYLFCCPNTENALDCLRKDTLFNQIKRAEQSDLTTISQIPLTIHQYITPQDSWYFENSLPWLQLAALQWIQSQEVKKVAALRKKMIMILFIEYLGKDLALEILTWTPSSEEELVSFPYLKLAQCCGCSYLIIMGILGSSTLLVFCFYVKEYNSFALSGNIPCRLHGRLSCLSDFHDDRMMIPPKLTARFNNTYQHFLTPIKKRLLTLNDLCCQQQIGDSGGIIQNISWKKKGSLSNMDEEGIQLGIRLISDWSQEGAYVEKHNYLVIPILSFDHVPLLADTPVLWKKTYGCPINLLLLEKDSAYIRQYIIQKSLDNMIQPFNQVRNFYFVKTSIYFIGMELLMHAFVAGVRLPHFWFCKSFILFHTLLLFLNVILVVIHSTP